MVYIYTQQFVKMRESINDRMGANYNVHIVNFVKKKYSGFDENLNSHQKTILTHLTIKRLGYETIYI